MRKVRRIKWENNFLTGGAFLWEWVAECNGRDGDAASSQII